MVQQSRHDVENIEYPARCSGVRGVVDGLETVDRRVR